jgi:hypothetical protein
MFMAVGREHQVVAGPFLPDPLLKPRRPTLSLLVPDDSDSHTVEIPINASRP